MCAFVLGMRVDLLSTKEAVSRITNAAKTAEPSYCCATNDHQCIMTYDDPDFRKIIHGPHLVISDSTVLRNSAEAFAMGLKQNAAAMRAAELMNEL
jgi:UDP-N-acetyl-D-mannosaminuronic acid transferase (WecB/TagA/CpsF family)